MTKMTWLVLAVCVLGCSNEAQECGPDNSYDPGIGEGDLVALVDNPLWPLVPFRLYNYEGSDGGTVVVYIESTPHEVFGSPAVVVHRTVGTPEGYVGGSSTDWYAQDRGGSVWHVGTAEYDGGEVSSERSWKAGVNGALPGIVMYGTQPAAGEPYRQEYVPCEAEGMAEVVSTDETVIVPFGTFEDCLQTREFTPLEPEVNKHKYYCPGIGLVLEVDIATGKRLELARMMGP